MRVGERVAFWYGGELHAGKVTTFWQDNDTVMVKCSTIDYDLVMLRGHDILKEEDNDDDG